MNQGEFVMLVVTCLILFTFFILTLLEETKFKRNGRIIEGTIVKLDSDSDSSGKSPTVNYYDDITKSNNVFKSNAAFTQFKKVGDKYKIRVLTSGEKRKHEALWALHYHSVLNFILFILCFWLVLTYLFPNNSFNIDSGYEKFWSGLIIQVPIIVLSLLFYLNRKSSSY